MEIFRVFSIAFIFFAKGTAQDVQVDCKCLLSLFLVFTQGTRLGVRGILAFFSVPGPICTPCAVDQVCSVQLLFGRSTPVPPINTLTFCRDRLSMTPNQETIFVDNVQLPGKILYVK